MSESEDKNILRDLILSQNADTTHFLPILIPIFSLSIYPIIIMIVSLFEFFSAFSNPIFLFFTIPLYVLLYFGLFLLINLVISKLFLILLNLVSPSQQGVFLRDHRNHNFLFFCIRKIIKGYIFTLYNYFPLPWAKILVFKVFNMDVTNSSSVLDSYIDSNFIKIGKDTILGEGSVILSSMRLGKYLFVKQVEIKDYVTIGNFSIVSPGTIIEKNVILGMGSYTKINQHLEEGWIYTGQPAEKLKRISNNYD